MNFFSLFQKLQINSSDWYYFYLFAICVFFSAHLSSVHACVTINDLTKKKQYSRNQQQQRTASKIPANLFECIVFFLYTWVSYLFKHGAKILTLDLLGWYALACNNIEHHSVAIRHLMRKLVFILRTIITSTQYRAVAFCVLWNFIAAVIIFIFNCRHWILFSISIPSNN